MKAPLFLLTALLLPLAARASTTVVTPSSDFFTSAWAFGAPYVLDAGRDHLGISGPNPYGMDESGSWAEVTYLTFDSSFLAGITSPLESAILTFTTTSRTGIPTALINISAHYLTADPATSINPALGASSPGSYFDFQSNHIGGVIDSVLVDSHGVYQLDVTALVNEWLTNGDTNAAYALALAGLEENEANPDGWAAIVNTGYAGAPTLTLTTSVPEPGGALLASLGAATLLIQRRRLRSAR